MTRVALLLVPALWIAGAGCGHSEAPTPEKATAAGDRPAEGGAQIWAESCSRCHNLRPPQSFSSAQWDTIVHHMRLRANLTGAEARAVTEFLQSSN